MSLKGKSMAVKYSSDGSTWYTIDEINEASMNIEGQNQDITKFGQDYVNRLQGLKDVGYSISGFYDPDDTNGQVALLTAFLADTDIYFGFLPNGTTGWEQLVKVSSLDISGSVDGVVEFSCELEGADAIAAYST